MGTHLINMSFLVISLNVLLMTSVRVPYSKIILEVYSTTPLNHL